MATQPIPNGYRSVTPSFTYKNTKNAIDFYAKAFGAKTIDTFASMDGKGIMHAVIQIGDSRIMMGDEMPHCPSAETMGNSPIGMFLYVTDVDAAFKKAIAAGATEAMPVSDMFWGDRAGSVKDPFGYSWMIATHTQDFTPEQIRQNAEKFFAQMAANGGKK